MNIISLDLEMNQPSQTIIQVGFAVGHIESGLVLESGSHIIKTEETLNPFIKRLTGIKEEQIKEGMSLSESYQILKEVKKEYQCFRNCLTWGGGDSDLLRKQMGLDNQTFIFGRRWIDAKTIFISRCFAKNDKFRAGLKKACTHMDIQFQGHAHNAEADAINTFMIYYKMIQELK